MDISQRQAKALKPKLSQADQEKLEEYFEAVRETGTVPDDIIVNWLTARESATTGLIGHLDLWAVPGDR